MKFSLSWISKHIEFNSDITIDKISDSLTSLGLEVESITDSSKSLESFLIAKIIEVTQHPNADRLNICKIKTDQREYSVVCGASNVKKNLKVVFAPIGATIPSSGLILKKKDIRGYTGEGMLCSSEELGFETKSNGILELPDEAPVGKIYSDWLGLSDPIFEVGLTPNRGDCASVLGIARELAVIGLGTLIKKNIKNIKGTYKSPIKWEINLNNENKEACSYVKGRHFRGVKNVESPEWLKKSLVSIGLKPISSLVDITNFITFDLGRPLHVFDASKIKGNLNIRMASQEENLLALDEKTYNLTKSILVISDENKPISIAGVMGGEESACNKNTTEIFIESAYFAPQNIAISGRSLNILSDARYRFERGIDPNYVNKGIDVMTELVLEICGGEVSEEEYAGKIELTKKIITFNCDKVLQIGGVVINKKKQKDILLKLGFKVEEKKDQLLLSVPTWRHDIKEEVDVVEELLRVNGYDKLIELKLHDYLDIKEPVLNIHEYRSRLITKALVKRGLYEVVTFSFLSEKSSKLFKNDAHEIIIDNPISKDLSIMRASLLPNIIDHFIKNNKKGLKNSGLFEVGSIYRSEKEEDQLMSSAGIRAGKTSSRHWSIEDREVDIFDVKKDAFKALEAVGVSVNSLILDKDVPEWYHPGRAGSIKLGKTLLGYFGELHPRYSEEYNMRIVCFELLHKNIPNSLKKKSNKSFVPYTLMPIKRDFAFLIDLEKPAEEIISSIKRTLREIDHVHMLEINLFDVYSENLSNSNKKSLAIEVIMQPLEKTLKENEIFEISELIIKGVKKDTDAVLRD
jgi:phenylalanyl-tRNA synthetase beta chain